MPELYDSQSGQVPAGATWSDLDATVAETLERTRRPHSANDPVSVTVDGDDIERVRAALRSFTDVDDLPERVELAATTLDVSLQEPQACVRRRGTALDIEFHPTDVTLMAVALATTDEAPVESVFDPDDVPHGDLFDRLRQDVAARET